MYTFSQGQVFIVFLIIGLCIGSLFDFFRAIRKNFKTSDFVTYVQDIIFMALVGILIVNTLIIVNNGQIRFYVILAVFVGLSFYFVTISKICFMIFQIFLKCCKKILFILNFFKNFLFFAFFP